MVDREIDEDSFGDQFRLLMNFSDTVLADNKGLQPLALIHCVVPLTTYSKQSKMKLVTEY